MRVTIDRAGRVVVPKALRDELGLEPETPLEIEIVDGHIELTAEHRRPAIINGPNGPVLAPTGAAISDADVRRVLEAARERR